MGFVGVDDDLMGGLLHSKSTIAVGGAGDSMDVKKLPTLVALGLGTEQENDAR